MSRFLFPITVLFSFIICQAKDEFCYVPSGDPISCSCCIGVIECPSTFKTKQWREPPSSCANPSICCMKSAAKFDLKIENLYKSGEPGYKSFQKCAEYSKQTLSYKLESDEAYKCEYDLPTIVGGIPAQLREYPHMAALRSEDSEYFCGGTLISERFILTAAHCLGPAAYARLGVLNLTEELNAQDIKIKHQIRHPSYQSSSHYHDVGLLELEKPAILNPYVRPACLILTPDHYNRLNAVATGWGLIGPQGIQSIEVLMQVPLVLKMETDCERSYRSVTHRLPNGITSDSQLCAGSFGHDTCKGDSGGPLQIHSDMKCMYEIIGITSFGNPCGGSKPGVYTRVSHYLKWIEDIVWKD